MSPGARMPATGSRQPIRQSQQPAPAPVDVAEELQKFAALRDQGILTEEEFAAQKARLLSL